MAVDDMLATPTLTSRDMPYVRFETQTIEDAQRTKAEGVIRHKDQDYAIVTVPGDTKSNSIEKVETFFRKKQDELHAGRVHPDWLVRWKQDYERYKSGQEIPLEGTPIKGWKLLTGSQQEDFLRMNVRTVEELANLTDDGVRNFGMGAVELKRRAQAWIAQNASKETGALRLTELGRENDSLRDQVLLLSNKIDELEKALSKKR